MIVRIVVLMFLALGVGSAGAGAGSGPVQLVRADVIDEQSSPPARSECGASALHGPSLDDPNVDTDPDRPTMQDSSAPGDAFDEGSDNQSDNDADGQCRSESLELQFQQDPDSLVLALGDTNTSIF